MACNIFWTAYTTLGFGLCIQLKPASSNFSYSFASGIWKKRNFFTFLGFISMDQFSHCATMWRYEPFCEQTFSHKHTFISRVKLSRVVLDFQYSFADLVSSFCEVILFFSTFWKIFPILCPLSNEFYSRMIYFPHSRLQRFKQAHCNLLLLFSKLLSHHSSLDEVLQFFTVLLFR